MRDLVWRVPEREPPIAIFNEKHEWGSFSPGLDAMRKALRVLGDPQQQYPHVLIGGTNGKGTVAYNLSLNIPGKCGCFLSPHVVDIRERILINGVPVSDALWQQAYGQIRQHIDDNHLSYFEWALALAVTIFAVEQVDFAVFEVGVGGKDDATNVLDPIVSCLTSLGLDHQAVLGNSLEDIAVHKAGIGRAGRDFLLPSGFATLQGLDQVLAQQGSRHHFHSADRYDRLRDVVSKLLELLGYSQKVAQWRLLPGRRMRLWVGVHEWYLDGAHNAMAWDGLAGWLKELGLGKLPFIAGLSRGRDPEIFIQRVKEHVSKLFVWHFEVESIAQYGRWQNACREANIELEVIDAELFRALQQQACVVTGSLYLVGQALRALD